ncbi:MAG: putative aminotransferase [Anaerolineales bacterium]|nr:putative aminotransferase [Anaerolineales bacterium]
MHDSLKSEFLLDPNVVFLNHGSFGACPKRVFDDYQRWQLELERQPVEFLGRRITTLLAEARAKLAEYVGAATDEVVYFPNPTTAINMVARSLNLKPGDEILTTEHEYGAMDRTWRFVCNKTGARYLHRPIRLPVTSHEEFVEAFWAGTTERTRAIFISHITSPTALIFPVQEICRRAREAGLLSVVDGAHAPGQIPLNLAELGADLYTGACHKWLCGPKGSAFLYARREVQAWLEPLVVSWGWESETPSGSQFVDHHEWQGTRDVAAFLATPAAIQFQAEHDWGAVRAECHGLASETRRRIDDLTGLAPICPDSRDWFSQMAAIRLPPVDVNALKERLYNDYRVEVPLFKWNDQPFMRVSFQGYNSRTDADALVDALKHLMQP